MERYEEIERSITVKYRAKIWSRFIKGIKEYELIQPGDRICVCISGGKDSMLLAKCMELLHRYSDFHFEVEYLVMNPGYNQKNFDKIIENLQILNIKPHIVNTDIFAIANSQEKSPCYLCARMRRGALYRYAKELGCNKIALGHHFDDVIETILMNILQSAKIETMLPKLHSDNYEGMQLIRPLYCVRENDIISWSKYNNLEFIACACAFTEEYKNSSDKIGSSRRAYTKALIKELKKTNEDVEGNIFKCVENINLEKVIAYRNKGNVYRYLDNYDNYIKSDSNEFERTKSLIGTNKVNELAKKKVIVFGVGGVGSYVCEALARGGIGQIDLVDGDTVSLSNINRQLVALHSTVGHYKVDVMKARINDINPNANVNTYKIFYLPKNSNSIDFNKYDYVVDCVDTVTAKIEIIKKAKEDNVRVISSMGTGNKLDPSKFLISDISKTSVCPLAKVMRHELKALGIKDVKVLYSKEEPRKEEDSISLKGKSPAPGSISFVPSVAGLLIAGEVIKDLIRDTNN